MKPGGGGNGRAVSEAHPCAALLKCCILAAFSLDVEVSLRKLRPRADGIEPKAAEESLRRSYGITLKIRTGNEGIKY